MRAWNELGFTVDVIDWDNGDFVPLKNYDFFIDIHSNMERLAPLLGKDCVKIFFTTGAHWLFQDQAAYERLLAVQHRRGVTLSPRKVVPPSLGLEHADYHIMIGNDFARGTFAYAGKPAFPIRNHPTRDFPPLARDHSQCRKNFLWLGSLGMVLKGLDLVLEAFAAMPDCTLTVCGPVHKEQDFEAAYRKELYETPNIRTVGWVNTSGGAVRGDRPELRRPVFASASESQSGSTLLAMHAGLIPVVSYESGVDTGPGGVVIRDISVEKIIEAVRAISSPAR